MVTLVFAYALVGNVIEKPDGIVISLAFIAGIVVISLVSRLLRVTELHASDIAFDATPALFIAGCATGASCVIANKHQAGDLAEYRDTQAGAAAALAQPRPRTRRSSTSNSAAAD